MSRHLTALAALLLACSPALAQENRAIDWSVGGSLRVRGFSLRAGTTSPNINGVPAPQGSSVTFMDTRLRLQLRAVAYEEVTMFLAVEVGDIRFGDEDPGPSKTAGGLGTDAIAFENKNLYLEWHPTRYSFRIRAGLYPRESDPYGLVLSDDVAGVHAEVELLGASTILYADAIKAVENSRQDLNGDGKLDNDFNDRNVFIVGATTTAIDDVSLELFGIADIDNSLDTPLLANTETDTYWLGLTGRTRVGPVQLSSTWIGAYGKRVIAGARNIRIKGLALDQRLVVELPFVAVEGIFAWSSGRDPKRLTTDEGFPTIAPFYGVSEIVFQSLGGWDITGSRLSGTAHATIKLRSTPMEHFDVELVAMWAWYTQDRDVSANAFEFNNDARDLGFEADLNLTYHVVDGFKVYARGAIFFPGHGYKVQLDTHNSGPLSQLIVGAQLSF